MEFKGTKGEWYLSGSTFVTTINEDICDVFVHLEAYADKQNEEQKIKAEANAKLISCAPETIVNLNVSNEMLRSVLYLFGESMALTAKFGIISQIEANDEIIIKATTI